MATTSATMTEEMLEALEQEKKEIMKKLKQFTSVLISLTFMVSVLILLDVVYLSIKPSNEYLDFDKLNAEDEMQHELIKNYQDKMMKSWTLLLMIVGSCFIIGHHYHDGRILPSGGKYVIIGFMLGSAWLSYKTTIQLAENYDKWCFLSIRKI